MKIAIIGTGYVGLVSGTCLAEVGHNVVCVDNNRKKIDMLVSGNIPIFESGLEELVAKNYKKGRLSFTDNLKNAAKNAKAIFIAVGTPPDGEEGGADLSYVYAVAKELANVLEDNALIVTKSTVPVNTGDNIKKIISDINPSLKFDIASNPEFLREGCAVRDFLEPDRVVIGIESEKARETMARIYAFLSEKSAEIFFTDVKSAELAKYASNAFLATKIGFINEISDICEKLGANVEDIAKAMGMDNRIGKDYLYPGPGFGGSCFPKDTLALKKMGIDADAPVKIVEAVIDSNKERKKSMTKKIIKACGGNVENKTIAILGLAFKANTDDMRYSPSEVIIAGLQNDGAIIRAFDPQAMDNAKTIIKGDVKWCEDSYETITGADAVVIVTEWGEFRNINLEKTKKLLKTPLIIDLRNMFSHSLMAKKGFTYISIGR